MKDTTKKIVTEKAEYDMELRKKLEKKQFNTDLSKEEYETLNNLLKEKENYMRVKCIIIKANRCHYEQQ